MNTPFIEKIPALYSGMSRQAPSVRFPGQVEDAKNITFNVIDGARKRKGTEYFKTITSSTSGVSGNSLKNLNPTATYRMHRIERDDTEEYAIIYGQGFFQVMDINSGAMADINDVSGGAALSYLSQSSPDSDQLKFATVADVTFIVNTLRTVTASSNNEVLNQNTMPIKLSRTNVSPLTFQLDTITWKSRSKFMQVLEKTSGSSETGTFKLQFAGDKTVELPADASAQQVEWALQGNGFDPNDFLEEVCYDQYNEDTGISDEVCSGVFESDDPNAGTIDALAITGLPGFPYGKVICTGGPLNHREIKIQISPDLEMEELVQIVNNTTGNTMVMRSGSDANDPPPEFVGKKISDIGFLRNRLVFSSESFVQFSQTDDFYNFYKEKPPSLIDSDRFALQLAGEEVAIVDFLIPFRRALLVLAKSGQQYEVKGRDVLSPSTVALTPATKYDTQKVRPTQIGDRLYMAGASENYSTLLEYFYDDQAVSSRAANLTKHVDDLVPPIMRRLAASPSQEAVYCMPTLSGDTGARNIQTVNFEGEKFWYDTTAWSGGEVPQPYDSAVITSGETVKFDGNYDGGGFSFNGSTLQNSATYAGKIYVYRAYTVGNERKQSAWGVWDFDTDQLMDIRVFDDIMLVLRRQTMDNGVTALIAETIDLAEAPVNPQNFTRPVHLDHMLTSADGVHSDGTTTWSLATVTGITGYTDNSINRVVANNGVEYTATTSSSSGAGTIVTVTGADLGGADVVLGRAVNAELKLSQVYVRDRQQRPLRDGRTRLKKLAIEHRRVGPYDMVVTSTQSECPDRTEAFTPANTGGTDEFGFKNVWIHGRADELGLTLKSDNSFPTTWTSLEFHGEYDTITE